MKYALAALAIVAAAAALWFRPPAQSPAAPAPVAVMLPSPVARPAATAAAHITVYVAGEVADPGVYAFAPGDRAVAALRRAGGPKPDADLVAVNLAAPLEDGEEVAVPKIGEPGVGRGRGVRSSRAHTASAGRGRRGHRSRKTSPAPARAAIDLNAADAEQLAQLPGVGPDLAERIVAFRAVSGPFTSLDELGDVNGISERLQAELGPYLFVSAPSR